MFCAIPKIPICLQEVKSHALLCHFTIFAATVQRVTSDLVAHIASLLPGSLPMGLAGDRTRWRSIMRRSRPRCADWRTVRLHRTACAAVRVTVQSRRCVAQHGCTRVCIWILHALCAQPRNLYSFVSAQADRVVAVHAGYSAEARRHLVESDIDGVMIADFVSTRPPSTRRTVSWSRMRLSPLSRQNSGAGPAGDVWRVHHACRRLPLDERYAPHAPSRASGRLCAHPSAAVRAPDRQIRFCVPAHPSDRAARGGLHQSGAPSVDIPHRRANGFHSSDLFDAAVPLAVSLAACSSRPLLSAEAASIRAFSPRILRAHPSKSKNLIS